MDLPIVAGTEGCNDAVIIQKRLRKQNKRASTSRQRKHQHLLDVKVRAKKAAARRTRGVLLTVAGFILVVSVLAGAALGAKGALNALFFANPDYALKTIDVTSDGSLTREAILRAAGVSEGENIFAISLPTVRDGLAAMPEVEDSRIQRILPNKLTISIQERRPVAWVVPSDANLSSFNFENAFLADERGILLKTKSLAPEYLGLPLIVGIDTSNYQAGQPLDQDEAKAALDLIRAAAEILQGRFQIQTIDVTKPYRMFVTDKQKASVTFSTDGIETQLHRLGIVLNYCDSNSRELQTVNLMAQRNVPVTFMQPDQAGSSDSPATSGTEPAPTLRSPDAISKPSSPAQGKGVEPSQSPTNAAPATESKSQENKQKRESSRLKAFRERRGSSSPSAGMGSDGRHGEPRVRRALPVEATRLNG
ncbi:MAG TPA: FtsQ-type POTRA domain-containing protein [Chthoniobacterales bacterium]|nr:FtsQ-type POTRA domain-containing protein [Chthoniobacterales bacterium]